MRSRAVIPLLILAMIRVGFSREIPRPNIVLIVTDDQSPIAEKVPGNYTDPLTWGVYGAEVLSPHVDALAREGMRFTDANVSSTVCSPSRYSMLTGRYAGRCAAPFYLERNPLGTLSRTENNVDLEEGRPNLPRLLQAHGYRTGFVGKSHVIRHELLQSNRDWEAAGLETYAPNADPGDPDIAAALRNNQALWAKWMRAQGFDFGESVYAANLRELFNAALNVHNLEWTVRAAQRFIDSSREEPFFLYFSTTLPHGPNPWIQRNGKFASSLDADPRMTPVGIVASETEDMPTRETIKTQVREADLPPESAYLTWMDAGVGAIVKRLERHGLTDNTLVILVGDHGAWRHGKSTLYEGGLRVPLIMKWPRFINTGRVYDGLISTLDFVPTILDAAGIAAPQDMPLDGLSLMPVFRGGDEVVLRQSLFAECGYARAVKTKDWKYIAIRYPEAVRAQMLAGERFRGFQEPDRKVPYHTLNGHLGKGAATRNPRYFELDQLYDLRGDPYEERNVAWEEAPQLLRMRAELSTYLNAFPNRPFGEFTD